MPIVRGSQVKPRSSGSHPSRSHRAGPALLVSATLLLGSFFASGVAEQPAEAKESKAKPSSLRTTESAKASRSAGVGAAAGSDQVPSDGLGNPANKTVLKADQLMMTKNEPGSGGNSTTRQAVSMNSDMASLSFYTPDVPEATRATIDHQYPSEVGRFVNGATESVLDLRKTVMGGDALYTLSAPNGVPSGGGTAPT